MLTFYLSVYIFSESLETHSSKPDFIRRRKVKKRLVGIGGTLATLEITTSEPTPEPEPQSPATVATTATTYSSTSSTTTRSAPSLSTKRKFKQKDKDKDFISPEQWLENFYNGKSLLR